MQIVDSHCHINFEELANRMPEILQNAKDNDITLIFLLLLAFTLVIKMLKSQRLMS